MKLIRLITNDSNSYFDNTFNEDIKLNPNSKLALQSIALENEKNEVVLNSSNNQISLYFGNDNVTTTASLTEGTYSIDNFNQLLKQIEEKLNDSLTIDNPTNIGLAIDVSQSSSTDLVKIIAYQNSLIDFFRATSDDNYGNDDVEDTGNNVYRKDNNTASAYDAALYGKNESYFFSSGRGCAIFRYTLNNLSSDNTKTGCYIGLSAIEPDNLGGDYSFATNKLKFGIEAKNTATNYHYIKTDSDGNTTSHASSFAPNISGVGHLDNDVLEISVNLGKVTGIVYSDGNAQGIKMFEEVYDPNLDVLFPIIAFKDQDDCAITKIRYTPYQEDASPAQSEGLLGTPEPPQQDRQPTDYSLTFQSPQLAQFLGFPSTGPFTDRGVGFIFTASNPPLLYDSSDAYLIELLNLKCESYDGLKNQRKNILAVIPNNVTSGEIIYETNTPFFINLNNAKDILLRNIRLRVVKSDYSNLKMRNTASIVLLLDDKN